MNVCVDENMPLITVLELRKLGHDVLDIRGSSDQSMSDEALWEMAQREARLLITTDKGFWTASLWSALCHFGCTVAAA